MNERIGAQHARANLPEMLRRVAAGETFTITSRGKPVADLMPSRSNDSDAVESAIAGIRSLRKSVVSDARLKAMKEWGRA